MTAKLQSFTQAITLVAGVAQPFTFDLDPTAYGGNLGFYLTLDNVGVTNPINTILWERSALGDEYVTDTGYATVAGTSLAASTSVSLDDSGIRSRYLRVTLTSTSGTTARIRFRGGPS